MSLPSKEVLDDIKDLITEITGFQENDENFSICERYCLSHVVHHTYPFVNRTTVKNLVNSYISRFYGHGYFRVSQELNAQVKSFLSNAKLFDKNPQYDIQWCLLSLLTSLSSNLTTLKHLPELLPIDNEESEKDDFDWKEYLLSDLPHQESQEISSESEDLSRASDISEEKEEQKEETLQALVENSVENGSQKDMEIIFDNRIAFNSKNSSENRRKIMEELLDLRKAERDIENDYALRRNISEKFDALMLQEGITRSSQLISEFELMENILYQFQTGERILLQKGFVNPSLTSLTQETLSGYLESLKPYFKIIRSFKDFDKEVTEARYWGKSHEVICCSGDGDSSLVVNSSDAGRRKIPNVLCTYNVTMRRALEPFQNEVAEIIENLSDYTLIQMEHKLKPHYFNLTSLFRIHKLATKDWKRDCNWMSSIRILSVLHNAIMDATSTRMSFLYLNLFLHCFQVYLDLIDSWISSVDLIDPFEEFVVAKSAATGKSEGSCVEFEIRPYKTEIENLGDIAVIDFISEKMFQVAESLGVLRRLNRFVTQETPEASSFHSLLKIIDDKVRPLEGVESVQKRVASREKKKKNIFTIGSGNFGLERSDGGGDSSELGSFLMELLLEEEKKEERQKEAEKSEAPEKSQNYCGELINSMVKNPFFKMAFDNIGMKQVQKKLEEAKAKEKEEELFLIGAPKEENAGIYPLQKIVTEAVRTVLGNRVSGACALVKGIVLKECNLIKHLALIRSVLLLSDSHLIQPFTLALFTQFHRLEKSEVVLLLLFMATFGPGLKIFGATGARCTQNPSRDHDEGGSRKPVIWGSSYSLSLHLKECVRSLYKDYANGLSVILTRGSSAKCENILQVIDAITVSYEVQWPLTLILTPETLTKYNEIFRLALKLKWAHWALCSVHFNSKTEDECRSEQTRHRLRLLRFWLLSDIGRLHNYFLAQTAPLDLKLDDCEDLKAIINAHSEFLEKIHRDCLLVGKSPKERKLILETLILLCMELVFESEGDADDAKLLSMAKTFRSCHLHLTRLLSSVEK